MALTVATSNANPPFYKMYWCTDCVHLHTSMNKVSFLCTKFHVQNQLFCAQNLFFMTHEPSHEPIYGLTAIVLTVPPVLQHQIFFVLLLSFYIYFTKSSFQTCFLCIWFYFFGNCMCKTFPLLLLCKRQS